ncbi:MAG: GH92 family glycosyl hydrolase [Flavobacteriales bacterium]
MRSTLFVPAAPRSGRCMHRPYAVLSMILVGMAAFGQVNYAVDLVNPFVGTGGHGHTFPGACVPNGLVQLSPDTRPDGMMDWDGCGGYHYSDSVIYGFSHTHLSGTGVADLCDVLLMPMSGGPDDMFFAAGGQSKFQHARESAHAGYYRVHLDDPQIDVELTASKRVGVHRYTYPKGKAARVTLDLRHRDALKAFNIRKVGDTEVVGERRSSSWAKDQRLFFCIRFSAPIRSEGILPSNLVGQIAGYSFGPLSAPLIVKVGISAVSIEGARANLDAEVPDWDFDAVRKQAEAAWNQKLDKIEVTGGTKEQQRIFYTSLYHCYVAPYIFNDVDGNYRGMDGEVHHADHNVYTVFSLWDTYRALHPLMTILEPEMTSDFIKTFLLHYQQGGKLPVWELWGNETDCMIGYHSVSVIADAYAKGIRDFDAELALKAMVASAMQDNPGLNAYRTKGYISSEDESDCVSKTLEYAYDDWCIARMAGEMRQLPSWDIRTAERLDSIAGVFHERGLNYQNTFNPRTGFFQARSNGGFKEPFDPFEVNFNFTEANAWQYSCAVQQGDVWLKALYSNTSGLADHLDRLFSASNTTTGREQADITGLIGQYAQGNEPSHHMAYLYNAVDRPDKTAELVHRIMTEFYHDTPDGLIGNEDCGQMSAWYVMSAMGFYPAFPGEPRYAGGSPLFDKVDIHVGAGRTFSLVAQREHPDNYLMQTTSSRGLSIGHDEVMRGGTLTVRMVDRFHPTPADPPTILDGAYLMSSGVPYVQASSRTFTDSLQVTIGSLGDHSFTYTVNSGAERAVTKGSVSFWIHETSEIRAWNSPRSAIAHFTRTDGTRTITLESKYANQYAAGGDNALIDGLRGGADFRTSEWQGYRDQDLVAMIDLGKVVKLKRVGLSVLQDQKSWIWLPKEVTISWSTNQRQWSSRTIAHDVDRKADDGLLFEIWTEVLGSKARYISIGAKNAGPCPDWHPGKGGTTWIFADEVLIETK